MYIFLRANYKCALLQSFLLFGRYDGLCQAWLCGEPCQHYSPCRAHTDQAEAGSRFLQVIESCLALLPAAYYGETALAVSVTHNPQKKKTLSL